MKNALVPALCVALAAWSSTGVAQEKKRDEFYWLGQINKASLVINTEQGLIDKALALWEEYAYRCAPDFHTIREREAWAAVAEYLVTRKENDGVGKSALCRIYGVGLALFNKNLARMREKLKEKDDGQD